LVGSMLGGLTGAWLISLRDRVFLHNVERMRPLPAWAEGYYRVGVHTTIKRRKHSGW
jgi:hypothetical protein